MEPSFPAAPGEPWNPLGRGGGDVHATAPSNPFHHRFSKHILVTKLPSSSPPHPPSKHTTLQIDRGCPTSHPLNACLLYVTKPLGKMNQALLALYDAHPPPPPPLTTASSGGHLLGVQENQKVPMDQVGLEDPEREKMNTMRVDDRNISSFPFLLTTLPGVPSWPRGPVVPDNPCSHDNRGK